MKYGDEVVIRVGEVLEEYFRGAMVFRLTGDEYLAIMENVDYEDFTRIMSTAHTASWRISAWA